MKIGINALPFSGYGGITYLINMLPTISKFDQQNEYVIFANSKNIDRLQGEYPNLKFVCSRFASKSFLHRIFWEQVFFPIWLLFNRFDVIFTANNIDIFFAPTRTVIAIRNMEPFFYQLFASNKKLVLRSQILSFLSRLSLKTASCVIFVSETSKKYFQDSFRVPESKSCVIYHGRSLVFDILSEEHSVKDGDQAKDPYIFASSKMVPYANLHNLILAFKTVRENYAREIKLLIAGGSWDPDYEALVHRTVQDCNLADAVVFLGYVDTDKMASLYRNASCFAFASRLEACPNTLIEAMASGAPIATSAIGVMKEFCQDAAVYFDPVDPTDIADKILNILSDTALRDKMRQNAVCRAREFDWQKTAQSTAEVLVSMGDGG